MTTTPRILPERLDAAIDRCPADRRAGILGAASMIAARGFKGALVVAAGLPSASVLADLLAGRQSGRRHADGLAHVLGVTAEWLLGSDDLANVPDWTMTPFAAWARWRERLRHAWRRSPYHLDQACGDSTYSEAGLGHAQRPHATSIQHLLDLLEVDRHQQAETLRLLADAAFETLPFALLLRLADRLGLIRPGDVEHVCRGHGIAIIVEQALAPRLEEQRRRFRRYLVPPRLHPLLRRLLNTARAEVDQHEQADLDDLAELLWRQVLRAGRQRRLPLPEGFVADTGRRTWKPLRLLQDPAGNPTRSPDSP